MQKPASVVSQHTPVVALVEVLATTMLWSGTEQPIQPTSVGAPLFAIYSFHSPCWRLHYEV